jgi:UDP-N-acetylmuramate-alanine ligase
MTGINKSKVASMIYSIYKNNGRGLSFSNGKPNEVRLKSYPKCIKEGLETYFVPEAVESKVVIQSEPEASDSKTVNISKSKNPNTKVVTNSKSKSPKIPMHFVLHVRKEKL